MNKAQDKKLKRGKRQRKIRAKISGDSSCPRLNVFRSNNGMYAQLIDDRAGKTLFSVHSREVKGKDLSKTQVSEEMGKLLAEKAKKAKIEKAVFDRGGYKYHGRVKALADGAREAGLVF